jgi:hypothetical protein
MVDAMRPKDDVVAMRDVVDVELVLPQDKVAAHGVVDGEPRDEHATCRGTRTRSVSEVVDDEPRDVPRHPNARRRRSSQRRATRRAVRRAEAPGRAA